VRLATATQKVCALEERIQNLQNENSLARFLSERNRSDDYRKHLGLISTIRQDFEALDERLAKARDGQDNSLRPIDRIVLYIDDLDRCPENKVMEVLQAVHLLLAYRLFVVVVGVDPRWLLHSLATTLSAFDGDGGQFSADPDSWRTTPQNYLEKIFQIPFSLRPMTANGFGDLIGGLLYDGGAEPDITTSNKISAKDKPSIQTTNPQEAHITETNAKSEDASRKKDQWDANHHAQSARDHQSSTFEIHEESLSIKPTPFPTTINPRHRLPVRLGTPRRRP